MVLGYKANNFPFVTLMLVDICLVPVCPLTFKYPFHLNGIGGIGEVFFSVFHFIFMFLINFQQHSVFSFFLNIYILVLNALNYFLYLALF